MTRLCVPNVECWVLNAENKLLCIQMIRFKIINLPCLNTALETVPRFELCSSWFTFYRLLRFDSSSERQQNRQKLSREPLFSHTNTRMEKQQITCKWHQFHQLIKMLLNPRRLSRKTRRSSVCFSLRFKALEISGPPSLFLSLERLIQTREKFSIQRLLRICRLLSLSRAANSGSFNANESKWSMWIVINGVKAKLDSFKHKLCTITTSKPKTTTAVQRQPLFILPPLKVQLWSLYFQVRTTCEILGKLL